MTFRLGVTGFGAMGGAILRGGIGAGVIEPREVIVVEPDDGRREIARQLGCAVSGMAAHAMDAEIVMLAVKPQKFASVARESGPLERPTVVISIMAGQSSHVIRQQLGMHARVLRVMPNTPCRIGAGISALAMGEGARAGDETFALQLFGSIGKVVVVEESLIHAVTALSGSGPAYVFLLAEAMEQAGMQMGMDRHTARALAYHTILGAGRLLTESESTSADALRQEVTSPGGTTVSALEVLFENELPQTIAEAIIAARDRGMELEVGE